MRPLTKLFLDSGYNDPANLWVWNVHGTDWIYPGGPDSTDVKNDVTFNQWQDLDDSYTPWTITEPVDMNSVDPWLSEVGRGIY
mmetsp:Transcript_35688/g.71570  ORF Transcript_35688/g.71570 Transcript_35688/m.71570 type:complete len:83 (+) Transcript_35688:55-303(+)